MSPSATALTLPLAALQGLRDRGQRVPLLCGRRQPHLLGRHQWLLCLLETTAASGLRLPFPWSQGGLGLSGGICQACLEEWPPAATPSHPPQPPRSGGSSGFWICARPGVGVAGTAGWDRHGLLMGAVSPEPPKPAW